jgi:hypothetical protein
MTMIAAASTREKPIIFSGPMVKAILEGRKTQTRRVIRPQPDHLRTSPFFKSGLDDGHGYEVKCPYYPGDRLWVRETCSYENVIEKSENHWSSHTKVHYRATEPEVPGISSGWKPSIFMPRWASRITLEVVDVRVERLQDISEADAIAEGVYTNEQALQKLGLPADTKLQGTCVDKYRIVWDSINGKKYPWASNPWVWCISFRRV